MRLEIPSHLLGQHRVLSAAGKEVRSGRGGTRTTVKFDDDHQRLVLDYRVPDGEWRRLSPDQASVAVNDRGRATAIQETSAEDFRGLLAPLTGGNAALLGP